MLTSLVYFQQVNVKKYKKVIKIISIDEEKLVLKKLQEGGEMTLQSFKG